MLKITISGELLDLPDDIAIPMIWENPLFLSDRIPLTRSLSFNLPKTNNNLTILSYPDRLNKKTHQREFEEVVIRFQNITMCTGVLTITNIHDDIELNFKSVNLLDKIDSSMYDYSVGYYDLGLDHTEANYNFMDLMDDALVEDLDFVCAPIRVSDVDFYRSDGNYPTAFGFRSNWEMYISYYDVVNNAFHLNDSIADYPIMCAPSPYVGKFFDLVFGSLISENVFNNELFSNLVLCNTYHPHYPTDYPRNCGYGTDMDISQFSSSAQSREIATEILKVFCATMYVAYNKIQIVFNKDIMRSESIIDWSEKFIGKPNFHLSEAEGYAYGFSGQKSEEIDYDNEYDDPYAFHLTTPSENEELIGYIQKTNQVLSKKLMEKDDVSEPDRYEYKVLRSGLEGSESGSVNMVSSLTPLPMNIHWYWTENYNENGMDLKEWYVPEWTGDRSVRPEMPFLLLFWGIQNTLSSTSHSYPYWSANNYSGKGIRLGDLSLTWEGADGLLNQFHNEFKQMCETDKIRMTAPFLLKPIDIANLDLKKKHHSCGKDWFIEKCEITFRKKSIDTARVKLVEAIDPSDFTSAGYDSGGYDSGGLYEQSTGGGI